MTGASLFTLKHADGGSGTPRLDPLLSSNRAAGAEAVRGISGPRQRTASRDFIAAEPVELADLRIDQASWWSVEVLA